MCLQETVRARAREQVRRRNQTSTQVAKCGSGGASVGLSASSVGAIDSVVEAGSVHTSRHMRALMRMHIS